VPVVAAGVHLSGNLRGIGRAALLRKRESVHIGAQEDSSPRRSRWIGGDPGSPDASPEREAHALEPLSDDAGGPSLLESQLRVAVKVPARLDQKLELLGGNGLQQSIERRRHAGIIGARNLGRSQLVTIAPWMAIWSKVESQRSKVKKIRQAFDS